MLAASLRANISVTGVPDSTAKLRDFEAKLDRISGKSATADLKANLESRGFDEYAAKIDEAKAESLRPITQDLKVKYDSTPANKAISDFEKLKRSIGGGGGKGLGTAIGEALTPFGKLPTVLAAASPLILDTIGGLTAIAGSAGEAAAGVGALGIAAGGVASVGLAGLVSVAVPAISGLKKLYSAQTKYTEAVKLYGQHSKEAATALAKLHLAEQGMGPEAEKLVQSLDSVKTKWGELTKSGQNSFLGIGADALSRFEKLMPLLAGSANKSVAALREGFDGFLNQVTGPGFTHFIETMTGTFAKIVPEIGHGLADWAQIFMRIAEDAAPSLEHIVHLWKDWSDELLKSTGNSKHMEGTIQGLVSQTMSWVHLLGAAGKLIVAVFSGGAKEGQRLVDDLTGKLEQWTNWIQSHQKQVHEFFHRAAETLRDLSTIFGSFLEQWVVFSEAMRPISEAILGVTKALNSIKIGNVSALTALLGAFVAARGIGKIGGAIADLGILVGKGTAAGGAASEAATVAEGAGAGGAAAGARPIISRLASALSPGEADLGAFGAAGAVAAGYFVTEFASKVVDLGTEKQSVAKSLFDGFNTEGVAKTEARALAGTFAREINHALSDGGNSKALENASHNRARTISKQQTEAIRDEASILSALKSGLVTRMGDIADLAQKGSVSAAVAFGKGSPQWRKATADNLEAVIEAIKSGEHTGLISAEEGQKRIGQAMRSIHLVTGDDPFGIAQSFASSWEKAGKVNSDNVGHAISTLEQMPPKARAIAASAMILMSKSLEEKGKLVQGSTARLQSGIATHMKGIGGSFGSADSVVVEALGNMGGNLNSFLKGLGLSKRIELSLKVANVAKHAFGFQRGGHIDMGAPSGDSVPAMLEKGEYVLNRNAVAAVGINHLDALNYGSHARFQKGGQAGRLVEPQVVGPGIYHTAAQGTIHPAYEAAKHYLAAHTPKGGGAAGYVPGGGGPVVAQMGRILLAAGYNKIGAAGVIGNALQESGWNPASVGSGGGGLLGFTTGEISLAALQAFAKKQRKPWTDVGLQMQFFLDHEYGIRAGVNRQKTPGAAAAYFMENWEHPAVETENQARRELGARIAFAKGYQHGGLVDPRRHLTPDQKRAYLAQKWGKRFANGGLVGQAERESGVPQTGSSSSSSSKPTPTEAVQWAMRHLGQTNDYGYPGEWCGAFLAADMKAIGLAPPAGYASAASWGTYGTPLGRGHMQAGAIIDYDGKHVAMAISGSQMIQGNDIHGSVGTSSIVSEVGGSPITAVRWPKYGSGPGAGSTPTEKTEKALHIPSVPQNIPGIMVELKRWEPKLSVWKHKERAAKATPKTQASIRENVHRIEKYLAALHRELNKLRLKAAEKRKTKHFTGQLGKITGYEIPIQKAQRRYEEAEQLATQIVAKEPKFREGVEGGEQTGALIRYINEREMPAWGNVLSSEADWRNLILAAEHKAAGNWTKGIGGLEGNWEDRIGKLVQNESSIESFAKEVAQEVAEWHKANGKGALPKQLKNRWDKRTELLEYKLPLMKFKEAELRKILGEGRASFYPGGAKITQPVPPLEGTGSFEEALREVQGLHWPDQHEPIAHLPAHSVAGKFGGAIWQTQETIEELGFNVAEMLHSAFGSVAESFGSGLEGVEGGGAAGGSSGATAGSSERERLLEELLNQSRQRELLGEIERQTLGSRRIPAFATGGVVTALVGERGPEIAAMPVGTRVHNASETRSMLQPHVRVHVHGDLVSSHPDPVQVFIDDERFPAAVKAVTGKDQRRGARTARRGLATAGV